MAKLDWMRIKRLQNIRYLRCRKLFRDCDDSVCKHRHVPKVGWCPRVCEDSRLCSSLEKQTRQKLNRMRKYFNYECYQASCLFQSVLNKDSFNDITKHLSCLYCTQCYYIKCIKIRKITLFTYKDLQWRWNNIIYLPNTRPWMGLDYTFPCNNIQQDFRNVDEFDDDWWSHVIKIWKRGIIANCV